VIRFVAVPELTRSVNIKLNKRVWLPRHVGRATVVSPDAFPRSGTAPRAVERSYFLDGIVSSNRKPSREQQKISAAKAKRHSWESRQKTIVGSVSRAHSPSPGSSRRRIRRGSVFQERRDR
jgi:hypothetical protein